MLAEGTQAPDFTLPDQQGDPVTLSDYRGSWVVVYFYPRADTPGCTKEACSIRDNWEGFAERDIDVIGISDDHVEDLADFAEKYSLPFTLVSDESGEVSEAYNSYGEKEVFGDIVEGVYRNTYVIDPDGNIALAYEGVSPDNHADELLADIPA